MTRLEHTNLTVSDPAKSAAMMDAIFGWKIRWQGPSLNGGFTMHVGNETDYLAFYTPLVLKDETFESYVHINGLNHVALVVDDLDEVAKKVTDYGFETTNHGDYEPGRRFYFHDHDNVEFEVVSYDS